ncbi:hypothetical protein [Longimicrobium sp.]|jgi:hypothetical protein|uniref:hypothetical protein n=1 Tax=Longimicrobium sp. TaxID=2029185 RepID=UPI002F951725
MEPAPRHRIVVGRDGFALYEDARLVGNVAWADVGAIVAYKSDDITTDTVWLEFHLAGTGQHFAIDEDAEGFWRVAEMVRQVFPDSLQEWRGRVLLPAFAAHPTQVYRRPDPQR